MAVFSKRQVAVYSGTSLRGLGARWSHWLGIGAIGLVDQSTGGEQGYLAREKLPPT